MDLSQVSFSTFPTIKVRDMLRQFRGGPNHRDSRISGISALL